MKLNYKNIIILMVDNHTFKSEITLADMQDYLKLIEKFNYGICLINSKKKIIHINKFLEDLTGFTNNTIQGKDLSFFFVKPGYKKLNSLIDDLKSKKSTEFIELEVNTAVNKKISVLLNVSVVYFSQKNEQIYFISITESSGIMEILYHSREKQASLINGNIKYETLLNNLQEGIWVIDKNAITTYVNPKMEEMLGYKKGEMLSKHLYDFMDERGIKIAENNLKRRQEGILEQHEFELLNKKGKRIFTIMETSPLLDKKGDYSGAIAGVTNITKRLIDEKKILESEKRYKDLIEGMQDIVYVYSTKTGWLYISPRIIEVIGYDSEFLMANPSLLDNSIHKSHKELYDESITDKSKRKDYYFNFQIKDAYGVWHWLKNIYINKTIKEDEIILQGIFSDITEQMHIEQALNMTRRNMENILNSSVPLCVINNNYDIIHANDEYCNFFGYEKKQVLQSKCHSIIKNSRCFSPDCELQQVLKGKNKITEILEYKIGQDQIKYATVTSKPFYDATGNVIGAVQSFVDITENKKYTDLLEDTINQKMDDIKKAQNVQKNLITRDLPVDDKFRISACMMPCENLGGDFFIVSKDPVNNVIVVILADSTGHGVEAALDATILKVVADKHINLLYQKKAVSEFLIQVNNDIMQYLEMDKFPTMIACVLDLKTNELIYANANGELPFLLSNGNIIRLDTPKGFFLGYNKSTQFETKKLTLKPGNKIIFYTDALFAPLPDRNTLTQQWVRDNLKSISESGSVIKPFLEKLKIEAGRLPLGDDLSLIEINYLPENNYKALYKSEKDFISKQDKLYNFLKLNSLTNQEIFLVNEILALFIKIINSINKNYQENEFCIFISGSRITIDINVDKDQFAEKNINLIFSEFKNQAADWIINKHNATDIVNFKIETNRELEKTKFKYYNESYTEFFK